MQAKCNELNIYKEYYIVNLWGVSSVSMRHLSSDKYSQGGDQKLKN